MTVNHLNHLGDGDTGSIYHHEVKVKTVFNGEVLILYMYPPLTLERFLSEILSAYSQNLDPSRPFTVKWLDDEGDPCTISSQRELDEAFRLYELNRDSELVLHIFPTVPHVPGLPCQGEDKSVYRRGARRWKKLIRVNGHLFQPKRFNKRALCEFCGDGIWGLGRQGYRCMQCRLPIHKRCHKLIKSSCTGRADDYTRRPAFEPSRQPAHSNGYPPVGIINEGFNEEHVEPQTPTPSARRPLISVDDFELLRVIGRGSYAKVLQVELKRTKQLYAMKIIKKEIVQDEEDIDWVQTEKHVFEIASNHPFLVGLHSCFQTASRLFFVIEFVPGGDLMFHMQTHRRLPEDHARFYSAEIILALMFLHTRGVIYRDLKLDNVLIDADGHIKLTDYGMCKENIWKGDKTSTFCGTPNYIAPEILRGDEYSFSVDWWALGVLMYEMMAGRSPFDIVGAESNPDANTEDYLFQIILEKQIRIPRSLSVRATTCLKGFLNKIPEERLGCHQETGFNDIQSHPFFKNIDWAQVEARQVTPPYRPMLQDDRDLAFFDKQFTDEPVVLTPDDTDAVGRIDQSEFDGFEYINPLLMSSEDQV